MHAHNPVLTKEVLEYLAPQPNENIIDATVGEGGHTLLILEKNGPQGKVLGIDRDAQQIEHSREYTAAFKERVMLVNDSYINIRQIAEHIHFEPVHGILLDLGYSSWHIENSKKGFSFGRDEVLDMRYDEKNPLTAKEIVNDYPEKEIEKILRIFGEEKFSKKIAKAIVESRTKQKIDRTLELVRIIEGVIPARLYAGKIHPATRTFQALRIAVNNELDAIAKVLPEALGVLSRRGRLVVISFHSLEDRIVKHFFNLQAKEGCVTITTKKPVTAAFDEVMGNARARSAKLRAIIKI